LNSEFATLFEHHPDMLVFPLTRQGIMDFVTLTGVAFGEPPTRTEQSFTALKVAFAVKSIKRVIQALIARLPNSPPLNCPNLLLNDNVDQPIRGIASNYYAHVCALELPFFDLELLELRSFLFFKFFEDQLDCLKLTQKPSVEQDVGLILGQWYGVEGRLTEVRKPLVGHSVSGRSASASTVATKAKTRSSFGSSQIREAVYFFFGLVIDDPRRRPGSGKAAPPPAGIRVVPLVLAAQQPDLQNLRDDFADIAHKREESAKMAQSEVEAEAAPPPKEATAEAGKGKKKPPPKPVKTPDAPEIGPLHRQAEALAKRAELQWEVALNKAELVIRKSN
jgi:hypothetical protein